MATSDMVGISDDWGSLRQNPVFRRELLPRGLRSILRSPVLRAILLTAVALAAFEAVQFLFPRTQLLITIVVVILFWFLIEAMQRWFCWMELSALAKSGTLDDYLNSGLSREDVTLGVIYPAMIAESIAIIGVIGYFLLGASDRITQIVLAVVIVLHLQRFFRNPFIFLPDVESYLRKRNPLSMFFIGIAVLVPLLIWFGLYFPILFGLIFGTAALKITLQSGLQFLTAFIATMFLFRFPNSWWHSWRLKRFYRRYRGFDDLFEKYIEQGA